jgi:hypothetical protein
MMARPRRPVQIRPPSGPKPATRLKPGQYPALIRNNARYPQRSFPATTVLVCRVESPKGRSRWRARRLTPCKRMQRCGAKIVAMGPGCAKTRSDLVGMLCGARISALFCSPRDHSPQNSGCICIAQTFRTAWAMCGHPHMALSVNSPAKEAHYLGMHAAS